MHKALALVSAAALMGATGWVVANQASVADVEAAGKNLVRALDDLARQDTFIVAADGEFLGKITDSKFDSKSIANQFGDHGGKYSSKSIFNEHGDYGSKYSDKSPWNKHGNKPPEILVKRGGTTYLVGLLTRNKYASTKGQRIDPAYLELWVKLQD
jgi:hypothetical protein